MSESEVSRMFDGNMSEFQQEFVSHEAVRPKPERLSELFAAVARDTTGNVSIRQLRDLLGDRSLAAFLLFFAALNLLPLPPGATLIFGLPLIIISVQMVFGAKTAWLPRFILDKSFTHDQYVSMTSAIVPRIERLERLIKPRYWPFWPRQGERFVGIVALVMAIAVTLPIPLGNWLPAFSTALLALALSERDGILFGVGCAIGALSLAIIAVVVGSAGFVAHFLWAAAFATG